MQKYTPTLEAMFTIQESCELALHDPNVKDAVLDVLHNYTELDTEQLAVMMFNVCANLLASVGSIIATELFDVTDLENIVSEMNSLDDTAIDNELQQIISDFR